MFSKVSTCFDTFHRFGVGVGGDDGVEKRNLPAVVLDPKGRIPLKVSKSSRVRGLMSGVSRHHPFIHGWIPPKGRGQDVDPENVSWLWDVPRC